MKLMCISPQRKKEQESLLSSSTGKNHWDHWWNVGRSSANGLAWLVLASYTFHLSGSEGDHRFRLRRILLFFQAACKEEGGRTGTPFPVLIDYVSGLTHTDDFCTLLLSHA
jgi:hypothetical protein